MPDLLFSLQLYIKHAPHFGETFVEVFWLVECCVGLQRFTRLLGIFELRRNIKSVLINQEDSLFFEPLHALSVFPQSELLRRFITVDISAQAMLFALIPPAFVRASISPLVKTVPLFLIVVVLTVVG